MIERILVAVDDSPDALAAARLAVELAAGFGATLRAVHVLVDHEVDTLLRTEVPEPGLTARRERSQAAVLTRVTDLATAREVAVSTCALQGDVAAAVLQEAGAWSADLVVVGRAFRSRSGEPYVGAVARHILEFAVQPVLIVPSRR